MYPWLRVARIALDRSGPQRVGIFDTTTVRLRAWPNDLDANLHVNNGRYLTLADLGRFDWFRRVGLWEVARKRRVYPVIGDVTAKFRRELRCFETFELRTRLVGWDHKWGFLEHHFVRDGRIFCVVAIRGLFTGPGGTMTPGAFLGELGMALESPPLPGWAADFRTAADAISTTLRAGERPTDRAATGA